MKKEETIDFIPINTEGKAVDLDYTVTATGKEEAKAVFRLACERLLLPSLWQGLAGFASASFQLGTIENNDISRPLVENDFIKIDIPGPGNNLGEGSDWVKVEAIKKNFIDSVEDSLGMRLRASKNPNTIVTDTAHFFNEHATSAFIITRTGSRVDLNYYGRNEMSNTNTINLIDNIRNGVVAAGAVTGLSNLQWHALLKGLAKK